MIADVFFRTRLRGQPDRKLWFHMLGCSLILHAALALLATAEWGLSAGKQRFAPVYSVDLVSMSGPARRKPSPSAAGLGTGRAAAREKAIPIQRFGTEKQALVLKKKQRVEIPRIPAEERELSEESLNKTEPPLPPRREEQKEFQSELAQPAPIGKKVSLVNIGAMKGEELSQALGLYRALVYEKIEGNWVLPKRLIPKDAKLEAVVVVRARRDGTVTDIKFESKSGYAYFDDSVLKAILKSKPLPPFPDIYSPKEEEIVIRFSPADEGS